MKAISLFSGVGGMDLGFERAGIETVLQAERDPHCLSVLARHWPHTRRVTDVRDVSDATNHPFVDVVYGGVPCQDWSVAGKREGITGARSGLFFEFVRIVREMREASNGRFPKYVVFENVPGLYSASAGRDFGIVLNGLAECGAVDIAWRTIDAQHWVPQRRRRVFVVAVFPPASDGRAGIGRAAEILSVTESCGGNPEAGRATGEGTPGSIANGLDVAGWDPRNVTSKGNRSRVEFGAPSPTLHEGGMSVLANAIAASAGHHGHSSPRGDGSDNLIANPLGAHHGRQDLDHDTYIPEIAGSFQAETYHHGGFPNQTMNGDNGHVLPTSSGVRRLTPLECERLMGWPDDWTRWGADGRELADSHRYRMCGNGVVSSVAEWIGHRLVAVDRML